MIKHINNGNCPKCDQIFDRYAGFDGPLRQWFKRLQKTAPEAHISCAGRGKVDQDAAFHRGQSKAQYGQSSHNYNMALDIFKLHALGAEWPREWFIHKIQPAIEAEKGALVWYGMPGSAFFELPHVEVAGWRKRADRKLVE
jgi:hypothetical protein